MATKYPTGMTEQEFRALPPDSTERQILSDMLYDSVYGDDENWN